VNQVTECPDPENLASLVEGRLSRREAEPVRAHLAGCERCFFVVSESLHSLSQAPPVPAAGRTWSWGLAAAAAVLVLAGGGLWWGQRSTVSELASVVGARRPVEGRITGGFQYAPVETSLRGGADAGAAQENWRLLEVVSRIRKAAAVENPSAAALAARGLADLVTGRVEDSVRSLEEAQRRSPEDARILSDLSATYLARAEADDGAEDRVRATDAAMHAVSLDPRLPEARFNLALALERRIPRAAEGAHPDVSQAVRAWNDYLAMDPTSAWASEARERLRSLTGKQGAARKIPTDAEVETAAREGRRDRLRELVSALPRVGRRVLFRRLCAAWAEGALAPSSEADRDAVAGARMLAAAIEEETGDRLGVGTVAAIDAARADPARGTALATGLVAFRDGAALLEQDRIAEAAPRFTVASRALAELDVPLRWEADFHLAIIDYYEDRRPDALAKLEVIDVAIRERSYPSLLAKVRATEGLLHGWRGELSRALDAYESARALSEAAGDLDEVTSDRLLIAEVLDLIGDHDDSWRNREPALAFSYRADPGRRNAIRLNDVTSALAQDLPWAARHFVLAASGETEGLTATDQSDLLLTRARTEAALDTGTPQADLDAAAALLPGIPDAGLRLRLEAEIGLVRGLAGTQRNPAEALEALEAALPYFESGESRNRVPEVEQAIGAALERLGRPRDAAEHYQHGLEAADWVLAHVTDEAQHVSALQKAGDLFDAMIRLQATSLGDPKRALEYAEQARRTDLGLRLQPAAAVVAAHDSTRGRTGPVVLSFVVLDNQLLRWVSTGGEPLFRPGPGGMEQIRPLVANLQAAVAARDDEAFRAIAARLYDALLRPVEDLLPTSGVLRIVPDRVLAEVPFAALFDEKSGRWVAERWAVAIAPSLALRPRDTLPAATATKGTTLIVADPAFDARRFPALRRLPEAALEGQAIEAEHPDAVLLGGSAATPARFMDQAEQAAVIHFAGHAFVNERAPLYSALVLAPASDGDSGLLTVQALRQAGLAKARLVVLGACRAGAGSRARAAGAFGLSRPFLMAGVPEIVAPLWDVRDRDARALLTEFHRGLGRGREPIDSLHEAQMEALRSGHPEKQSPIAWGAFEINSTIVN
jgi:CHAT domain-containing protein